MTDPHAIKFDRDITLGKILNYPHAGNDVLHCDGTIDGEEREFFIKLARHRDANA